MAGPTWHSKSASSPTLTLVICRLKSEPPSLPRMLYRGSPGIERSYPDENRLVSFVLHYM